MAPRHGRFPKAIAGAAFVLSMTFGASRLEAQAVPRRTGSHSFLVGVSIMNDRLDDHLDHRPIALGVEADYVMFGGPALRGGNVSLTGRAHYYTSCSLLCDIRPYAVTSFATGVAYHPLGDRRLDPYAGVSVRSRSRTKSAADSATVDALLDAGARLRLSRRVFAQAGMSLGGSDAFGLWRIALMVKF